MVGIAATVIAHVGVLAGVEVLDLSIPGTGMGVERSLAAAARPPGLADPPMDPSCDGEAVLRAAARAAYCATPFVDDARACLDEVQVQLENDFILCHIDQLELLPAVQIVDARQVEQLEAIDPIDPEPLLEPLTPEEMQRFEEKKQEVAMAPPPPPPPEAAPPMQAQVIETVKPAKEEAPDEARFLAEFDSKADQQKVARGSRHEDIAAAPDPEELKAKKDPKPANLPEPAEDDPGRSSEAPPVIGALSMRRPGTQAPSEVAQEKRVAGDLAGRDGPTGDGVARKRGDGAISQQERKPVEVANRGEGGAGGGAPRAPSLRPDDETLERLVGGGSVDHVEDVEEGDENQFNARRWVYATFFNRMKRQVAQNWDPATVWRREDPEGKHHGFKSRITQLRVSLDDKGGVKKIVVVTPSGVDALDEEAIRSFHAAQPFPNPPAALVDGKGLITFEFGFYFEINNEKRTSWKFNRSM